MISPRERAENLDLKIYKCYHCEGIIGMTSRTKLIIGTARFKRSVTMECGYCGRDTFWKPSNETITKNNGHST